MATQPPKDELDIYRNIAEEVRNLGEMKRKQIRLEQQLLNVEEQQTDAILNARNATAAEKQLVADVYAAHKDILATLEKGKAVTAAQIQAWKLAQKEAAKQLNIQEELRNSAAKLEGTIFTIASQAGLGGIVNLMKTWRDEYGKTLVISTLLIGIFKAIFGVFKQLDDAAWEFRKAMGEVRTATKGITDNANSLAVEMANIGVTATNFYDSMKAVAGIMGTTQFVTKDMAKDMSVMAAQVGVAELASAEFLKTMGMMGKTTMDSQRNMLFFAQHMAEAAGVPLNAIMEDVQKATQSSYQFLSRSPLALTKAAIEAKRMGTSLTSATKSAGDLVRFGESVKAEMEASVLLGTAINLQRARELAYRKDLRGLNNEILKIAKETSFEDLDPFQQEAVAKALGKSAEELGTMVQSAREQQQIENAINSDPALRDKKKLLDAMSKATASQAKNYAEIAQQQLSSQANQARITTITQAWHKIVMQLAEVFLPAIDFTLKSIAAVVNVISSGFGKLPNWLKVSLGLLLGIGAALTTISLLSKAIGGLVGGASRGVSGLFSGLSTGLTSLSKVPWGGILKGAAALFLLGAALIPFAFAMKMMEGVGWKTVGVMAVGMLLLVGAVAALGAIMMSGVGTVALLAGAAALLILGVAMIPFAAAAWIASKALQNLSEVRWLDIAKGIFAVGIQTPLILGMGLAMAVAAPGILAFSLALIPLSIMAKRAGDSMMNMGTGFKLIVDSIERLQNVSLINTILQVHSLAKAVTELSQALKTMPDIQVEKIERLQMRGAAAGETPAAGVKDTAVVDEIRGMRDELKKLREDFANGTLRATVNMDSQKVDSAIGRTLEFKGALV